MHLQNESVQMALVVKNPPTNAGNIRDTGLIPGLGRFPGRGDGNPLQYSFLKNPMGRGTWWAINHRIAESQTGLKRLSTPTHFYPTEILLKLGI